MRIKYLKHNDIDYEKWDICISQANNSLVYAKSWYLDVVSPGWEALVADDYVYVMPLPVKRKYIFRYLVQPILTQQLGIFSKEKINDKLVRKFIRKIPYLSYHLNLNEQNKYMKATVLPNYLLDLNISYERLRAGYSKNTKRNIEKADKAGLIVTDDLPANDFLEFYYSTEKNYSEPDKIIVEKLIFTALDRKKMSLYGVYNTQKELIAALSLLHSKQRFIYLLPVSNEEGKKSLAMFAIINEIIRNNSFSPFLLDFEGSRLEGIARLYKGFGGKKKVYYEVKRFRPQSFINKVSAL